MPSFIERYHELTKYNPRTIDRLGDVRWSEQPGPFKEVVGGEQVELRSDLPFLARPAEPERWTESGLSFGGATDRATLARLTWFSAGINAIIRGGESASFLRFNPSAGAIYPVELYWAILDVPGIEPGIYLFHPLRMALVPVWNGSFRGDLQAIFLDHPALRSASAVALLTGVFSRGAWRYQERAYRRILLDAGHLLGNLGLLTEAEGMRGVALGGFADARLSDLLFLDENDEVPLLGWAIGRDLLPGPSSPGSGPVIAAAAEPAIPMQLQAHRVAAIDPTLPLVLPSELPAPGRRSDLRYEDLERGEPVFLQGLHVALTRRRSCRSFSGQPLARRDLARALWFAYAPLREAPETCLQRRFLDTHLVVLDADGLIPGVFHYDPAGHGLALVKPGAFRDQCFEMCLEQPLGERASVILVHTSPLSQAVAQFGERAYRYLCVDAGHLGQRLNLAAEAEGFGFSGIGGYYDDLVNELLELPLTEAVLYVTTLGLPSA